MKISLIKKFYELHQKLLEKGEFGITKEDLIQNAIDEVAKEFNESKEEIKKVMDKLDFPEISFVYEKEYLISIYNMDEDGRAYVNPIFYYKEVYNNFMIEFFTKKFNSLLKSGYKVCIYQTEDYFVSECEEDSEYDDLPMYKAYLTLNDKEVEDITTGRYCDIKYVIDELERIIDEYIEPHQIITVKIGIYEISMHDTIFDEPLLIKSEDIKISYEELSKYCSHDIQSFIDEDDTDTVLEIIDEYIEENGKEILKKLGYEDFFSSYFETKRLEEEQKEENSESDEIKIHLIKSLQLISRYWKEMKLDEADITDYPFDCSFDELISDINSSSISDIKNIHLKICNWIESI